MRGWKRLSALIVDWRASAFALSAARSLAREWARLGGAPSELELVVIDNANLRGEEFDELERLGARVVHSAENLGYGSAANRALELTRGGARDFVAVLNPDVHFLPGSLAALAAHADDDSIGALAPACFIDPLCAVALPPNGLPTPGSRLRESLAQVSAAIARKAADERARDAASVWLAREPLELEMLSGAALFLRRDAIAKLGQLFDPRYPLYYEDTDLCRRLDELRLRLVFDPRSRIVHHWARSSGVGAEFEGEPRRRNRISERAYFERWHGVEHADLVNRLEATVEARDPSELCPAIHPFAALGATVDPIEIRLPRQARYLIELSMSPNFPLAAGVLLHDARWRPHARTWEWFFPGRYYVRALELDSLAVRGAWTFDKSSPSRVHALALDETRADRGSLAEWPA